MQIIITNICCKTIPSSQAVIVTLGQCGLELGNVGVFVESGKNENKYNYT